MTWIRLKKRKGHIWHLVKTRYNDATHTLCGRIYNRYQLLTKIEGQPVERMCKTCQGAKP